MTAKEKATQEARRCTYAVYEMNETTVYVERTNEYVGRGAISRV